MTTDTRILIALRGAGTGFASGAELSQQLGITRAAVWARIEEFRKLGYDIAAELAQFFDARPDGGSGDAELLRKIGARDKAGPGSTQGNEDACVGGHDSKSRAMSTARAL